MLVQFSNDCWQCVRWKIIADGSESVPASCGLTDEVDARGWSGNPAECATGRPSPARPHLSVIHGGRAAQRSWLTLTAPISPALPQTDVVLSVSITWHQCGGCCWRVGNVDVMRWPASLSVAMWCCVQTRYSNGPMDLHWMLHCCWYYTPSLPECLIFNLL